ncbi:HNH endonuclease family protein (plasmid) [Streptomyces sp. BB1-1-1]|uniref:HNH endonuclease family protein n=1 Tax=Streptomyces sp. BB1-1-1 TaxID=3074430 RepID=UPI00287805D2|nr:HNH endonuclease family protein [Streptomyces sp. BB1-1-1]WND32910.1 HNH endonuclease family protein [Streptomyces sp. BB1-1-1]WND40021.1 HNH endonuclease family protein [Streptomyces sp. BB1-1-1]WND40855.1 HNH endonuclease family protein [Streptomyces sp. BB1-1-1]
MVISVLRGLAAASLALLSVAASTPVHAAETLPLAEAVSRLPVAAESREGYDRDAFRHWNTGDDPADGCSTRNEVLLDEAVEPPTVGPRCRLSGGQWWSYYDQVWVTSASGLDIDHMVPLAESWDSGASAWTSERREAYANDQGSATSLVAVTARSNRSKADQDPAQWLPPATEVHCRYIAEWVGTKLRWNLSADETEVAALQEAAIGCPEQSVAYEPVA